MRKGALIFMAALLSAPATVLADDADLDPIVPNRPFERGTFELSGGLGVTIRDNPRVGFNFSPPGLTFGYYMLRGFELGIESYSTVDAKSAYTVSFFPFLRYVVWRSYLASPYIMVQGGFRLVAGGDPASDGATEVYRDHEAAVGGGAGVVLFGNRRFGIQFQGSVFRLFPTANSSAICSAYGCVEGSFGVTLAYYFGGFAKGGVAGD